MSKRIRDRGSIEKYADDHFTLISKEHHLRAGLYISNDRGRGLRKPTTKCREYFLNLNKCSTDLHSGYVKTMVHPLIQFLQYQYKSNLSEWTTVQI